MSKYFRKLIFCDCSTRSGLDSRSIVVEDESIVEDDPPKFPNRKAEPDEDLARHFDLSGIKYIDDDDDDKETDQDLAPCSKNGSSRPIDQIILFLYRKVGWYTRLLVILRRGRMYK